MRIRPLPLLLLGSLVAAPALADDVYLVNGRKFEGVVAEAAGSQVRIRMQGGTLSLPKDQVLRIDEVDSNLAEYLRRKDLLKKNPATRATDWLELSRWAYGKELDQAARESALAAAVLDPKLEGLGPVLRGYGYVLDPQLDRWIPYADSMRRRGFILSNGEWISREEHAARVAVQQEQTARASAARQEASRAAREDRLAALAELSVVRQLAQPAPPPYPYPPYGELYGVPVFVAPGFGGGRGGHHRPPFRPGSPSFTHIPGSLGVGFHIPGSLVPGGN
jgi:hypothetical protein